MLARQQVIAEIKVDKSDQLKRRVGVLRGSSASGPPRVAPRRRTLSRTTDFDHEGLRICPSSGA